MLENDERLFDEFKRVDKICGDIFSCRHGVSKYIEEMELVPPHRRCRVPSWDEDYRNLKRVRWLRNQIVHEMSAPDCDARDIEWLEEFHSRILRQEDPLAAAGMEQAPPQKLQSPAPVQNHVPNVRGKGKPLDRTVRILAGAVFAALAALLIVFLKGSGA